MSIIAALFLLYSPAFNAGNLDATYMCKVFALDGASREVQVKFTLKSFELRSIEFTDSALAGKRLFASGDVTDNRAAVYVDLPEKDAAKAQYKTSRVYSFDFSDVRFGEGSVRISQIVEPRPNVVIASSIEATGICTILIPKDAS
jgi:hypothetical protein